MSNSWPTTTHPLALTSPAYLKRGSDVAQQLRASVGDGLSNDEAKKRLETFGLNVIPRASKRSLWFVLVDRITDTLVLFLLATAVISLLLGEYADAVIIGIAVLIATVLSYVQVRRTERTIARLDSHLQQMAIVQRDKQLQQISASLLVPGDIIEVQAGDKIPADARLLSASGLRVQEAALTGESEDAHKDPRALSSRTPLANRSNMLFLGTTIVGGSGKAVVTTTGTHTEFGKIAQMLKTQASPDSPLRKKLQRTGIFIAICVVVLITIITVAQLTLGDSLRNSARTAITLTVSAIPEDLSIILTIALAVGALRILKRQGAVRELSAGESLGAATVICTDKTGTLTAGEMQADAFYFLQGETITADHPPKNPLQSLVLTSVTVASNAQRINNSQVSHVGSATERCALTFAEKFGITQERMRRDWRERDHLAFSGKWKYRATLNDHPTKPTRTMFVTGAPEVLLERSSHCLSNAGEPERITTRRRSELATHVDRLAADGYRLLGVAVRRNMRATTITHDDVRGLLFLGVLTIRDPIRPEARTAIQETRSAGIAVKIITGDHEATARSVAQTLGLSASEDAVITGAALQDMTDNELYDVINRIVIFARVSPLDKQRIIRALQRRGHVVAMTGDGINDAVALKSADIGVAMGSGKDIAKDASDLILLDDSFATIVAAIREGRILRDNVRKTIAFLLSTNVAEVMTFITSFILRLPIPLLPTQILWINIVTDGTSDLALALEPGEPSTMSRTPENPSASLLDRRLISHIVWSGAVLTMIITGLYWYLSIIGITNMQYVRTMTFSFMACASLASTLSFQSLRHKASIQSWRRNPWLIISVLSSFGLQLAAIYAPTLQSLFNTTPLYLNDWLVIILLAIASVIGIELRKVIIPYQTEHYRPSPGKRIGKRPMAVPVPANT